MNDITAVTLNSVVDNQDYLPTPELISESFIDDQESASTLELTFGLSVDDQDYLPTPELTSESFIDDQE